MRSFWAAAISKEYLLFLGVCFAGYFGASAWVILPGALMLTLFSVISDPEFFWRFKTIGKLHALAGFWLLSLLQNTALIALCYVAGMATRWLWGPSG